MLRARLATAAVVIPLLLLLILSGPPLLFAAVVGVIAVGGILEYAVMAFPSRPAERTITVALGAAMVVAGVSRHDAQLLAGAVALAVVTLLVWVVVFRADFERGLHDAGLALVGLLYVGLLMPHFVWLHGAESVAGPRWVIFVLLIAMAGDTAGYFVGRTWGRHKLIPRVSPGKTIEGAVGMFIASLAAGALAKLLFLPTIGWAQAVGIAAVMDVLGQVGDLSESAMKRTFGVKESGWMFPGHGGFLDRLDSLLFPVTFLYYYLYLTP
ncbi:phosphatidate cytidylyltransferase [Candidatus Binatia bacterium]|nr:phosphatidate cytidylyltransferase [Candidatus Binatia bacterium]